MDTSKDIVPNMADSKGEHDDSSDVITTPDASLYSLYNHRRDSVTAKSDLPSTHTHHPITTTTTTTFNDDTANWRKLSQPRARRLIARHGLGGTRTSSLKELGGSTATSVKDEDTFTKSLHHILGSHEADSHSLTGSELRNHFGSLDRTAVAACIEERIRGAEVELDRLGAERETVLRELRDEMERADVDERWEEGIMAIDEMI